MGMATRDVGKQVNSNINVTPMVDVMLVLLIIFMVITPSAVNGFDALLPQPPRANATPPPDETIVVELRDAGDQTIRYAINQQQLSKEEVAPRLAAIFANRTNRVIFLEADATLDFSPVAEVIDAAHRAGIHDIGLLTPRTKGAP